MTEEQKIPLCYSCLKSSNCDIETDEKNMAQRCERKFEMPDCPEYKPKKPIDLYEEQRKNKDYLKTDSLEERLMKLQQMNFITSFKGDNGKEITLIDTQRYIFTVRDMLEVKTLITESSTDNPPMYLFGDGYFRRGVEHYFKQVNYRIFGSIMNKRLHSEYLQKLQAESYVEGNYFEQSNPNFLNVQNGVLDLRKKRYEGGNELRIYPHNPDYRMMNILPVKYDPDTVNGEFIDFNNQIVKPDDVKILQEIGGDCLYPSYWIQKAFLFSGHGADGKTQWLNVLQEVIGKVNCSFETLQAICDNKYRVANLYKKYVNISPDLPSTAIANSAMFKALTGGDTVSAEKKNQQSFNFRNHARLIFPTNKIPSASDTTFAWWRRWIIIYFPYTFEGEKETKEYYKKLTDTPEKLSGILNWYIEGLQRLFKNEQYSYSKTSEDVEKEWKERANTVTAFIELRLQESTGNIHQANEIWNAYLKFCSDYDFEAETCAKFWRDFNDEKEGIKVLLPEAKYRQYTKGPIKGKYYWENIKIK